jgi:uncharacterized circularly permuted ATP-grasp superfamily protein/uncharacterized alpha-E superfamily protein
MSTLDSTALPLEFRPATFSGAYDEAFDGQGKPRAWWKPLFDAARDVPIDEFLHRANLAEQQLRENGVTFNIFREGNDGQRPWRLDLLPVVYNAAEWKQLEQGLDQRARLLQWIVRDCHGPQTLLKDGSLPAEILFANPRFTRTFQELHTEFRPSFTTYAAELARDPSGHWRVMADRTESPSGMAFALENRIVVSRTIPPAMHGDFQRLAPFFLQMQDSLRRLGSRYSDNPRIVLLSPGSNAPFYFEDVYLARYLGYTLVEGADLAVRDDRVFLKTLAGLIPIDVVLCRGNDRGIDPLELGGGGLHGVPGILQAMRKGNVVIANTPGAGLIESPVFMAFLPELCRRCLNEDLHIQSIPTWWCGDQRQFRYVQENLSKLVIKPAFPPSGDMEIFAGQLSHDEQRKLIEQIKVRPYDFIAQEFISRSAAPVFRDGRVDTGHVAIRTFMTSKGEGFSLMPGGLVRIAPTIEPMQLTILAGEGSKDLWVLADGPVEPVSLLTADDKPVQLRRTSAVFPSRVADDLYWLGQSLDRADFLCRLLRSVIERLSSESPADMLELPALVRALADQGQVEPGFAIDLLSSHMPQLEDALPRMVADATEVRGLSAAVSELHRLASLERLWISPDTWRQIHDAALKFQGSAGRGWTGLVDVLPAINTLILDLAAVSGLIHDGMIRSPAWRLLDIGRRVEHARNVLHLLKSILVKGAPIDRAVLKALLEVIDCRMTYRSRYLDNLQQNAVLDLCLTDETCPRSIVTQLVALVEHVDELPSDTSTPLRTSEKRAVMSAVHSIRMLPAEVLSSKSPEPLLKVLNEVDDKLRALSELLTRKYLLHSGQPRQITSEMTMTS